MKIIRFSARRPILAFSVALFVVGQSAAFYSIYQITQQLATH